MHTHALPLSLSLPVPAATLAWKNPAKKKRKKKKENKVEIVAQHDKDVLDSAHATFNNKILAEWIRDVKSSLVLYDYDVKKKDTHKKPDLVAPNCNWKKNIFLFNFVSIDQKLLHLSAHRWKIDKTGFLENNETAFWNGNLCNAIVPEIS